MKKGNSVYFKSDAKYVLFAAILAICALAVGIQVCSDSSEAEPLATESYYFDQMSDLEKSMYNAILVAPITIEDDEAKLNISLPLPANLVDVNKDDVSGTLNSALEKVVSILHQEKVRFFYYGGGPTSAKISYNSETDKSVAGNYSFQLTEIIQDYGTDASAISSTLSGIDTAISASAVDTTNRYSAVRSIHDIVLGKLSYYPDLEHIPETMDIRNIAKGLIGDGVVVCEGYAKVFKAYCDAYGIPCIIVTGQGVTSEGSEGHMWNYVQMESGKWYLVDCTWDDQNEPLYDFFLAGTATKAPHFGDRTISESYVLDEAKYGAYSMPSLSATAYKDDDITITFLDDAGNVIDSPHKYSLGDTIKAPTVTKSPTNEQVFTFDHWIEDGVKVDDLGTAEVDTTYKAAFRAETRYYTVTFAYDDGATMVKKTDCTYNSVLIAPSTEKDHDDYYSYTFVEWSPALPDRVTEDNKIYTAKYDRTLYIKVTGEDTAIASKTGSILLDAATLTDIKTHSGNLTITLDCGTVVFDHHAVNSLLPDKTLDIKKVDSNIISSAARSNMENPTVFSIDFGENNTRFESGNAVISLKFDAGHHADEVKVYYVAGDSLNSIPCEMKDGYVVFSTTHFSYYAVDCPKDNTVEDLINLIMENYVIVLILLFAIIGMALAYKFS